MDEFNFIARHFRALAGKGSFSLRNDGAVISLPPGRELVVSTDTMVENYHFLPDDPACTVGRKLLRCNLSDLAAMGAQPHGYTLTVSVPQQGQYDDAWFSDFVQGLASDQKQYGLCLLGGDTTGIAGPLVLGMTIFGFVTAGQTLRRDQSCPGHSVWVTGCLGDAVLGLAARQGKLADPQGVLTRAYQLPVPRLGLKLHGIASSVMDVSDGIVQDAGHLATESGVGIVLEEELFPFSEAVRTVGPQWHETRLLGGDDYELLMTCPPENETALHEECQRKNVPVTRIGRVISGQGVVVKGRNGHPLNLSRRGWQHF